MSVKRALDIRKENEDVLHRLFKKMDLRNISHIAKFSFKKFHMNQNTLQALVVINPKK